MPRPIEDATVAALRVVLSQNSRRATVIASNMANVDTPGYKAMAVSFEESLEETGRVEPARTQARHLGSGPDARALGTLVESPATRIRNDGNTVDIDREMTLLAGVQGRYQSAAELVRKRFGLLMYAGTDGRSGG